MSNEETWETYMGIAPLTPMTGKIYNMKKGYKATINMRCESLTYEVGKEYIINNKKMDSHGFYYCKKLEHTLDFYDYKKGKTVFIEIEDLDPEAITVRNKTVSSHIRVLRVVPKEELPDKYKFDQYGNMTSNGDWESTYDEFENQLTYKDSHGFSWEKTYDKHRKVLTYKDSTGFSWEATYDEKGNQTFFKDSNGFSWEATYDEFGNQTFYKDSNGVERGATYDKNGNQVYFKDSDGVEWEITIK